MVFINIKINNISYIKKIKSYKALLFFKQKLINKKTKANNFLYILN